MAKDKSTRDDSCRRLWDIGYRGPLTIEREIPQDPERQKEEISGAISLIESLTLKSLRERKLMRDGKRTGLLIFAILLLVVGSFGIWSNAPGTEFGQLEPVPEYCVRSSGWPGLI